MLIICKMQTANERLCYYHIIILKFNVRASNPLTYFASCGTYNLFQWC